MARVTRSKTIQKAPPKMAPAKKAPPIKTKRQVTKKMKSVKTTRKQTNDRQRDQKSNAEETKDTVEVEDDTLGRRSSDRKKVAVDRYGLNFIFIPKSTPRSPLSSVSSTAGPSTSTLKPTNSTKTVSKRKVESPKLELKSAKSASVSKPNKKSKPTDVETKPRSSARRRDGQRGKDESKSTISKKDQSNSTAAKSKTPVVKKTTINAMSSRELEKSIDSVANKVAQNHLDNDFTSTIIDETTPSEKKKRKRETSTKPAVEKKMKQTVDEVAALVAAGAESESDDGKEKGQVAHVTPKKEKDRHLKPKPNLRSYFHEPTFESKDELPFVSVPAYSKLAIRAVLINNENLLQRLIDDVGHVHSLKYRRSVDVPYDAATYALCNGNAKLLQMIIDEEKKPKCGRVEPVRSLLVSQTTGKYNYRMLGHNVRPIQMSRGGKEGINALTKDGETGRVEEEQWNNRLMMALQKNIPFRLVQQLQLQNLVNGSTISSNVNVALRFGHNKLAGAIVRDYGIGLFNELHQQVLLNEKEPLKPFKAISIKKKGVLDITPFHCACINANEKYLAALIAVESDFNHTDKHGYRPIHYAAACSSSGPLKLLLQRGAQPGEVVKDGENALHVACLTGRAHNVELILQHCKITDPELNVVKHKSKAGLTPVHLAASYGHLEVIKQLRRMAGQYIDIDQVSGSHSGSVTALMLASQQGRLPVVEYLIKEAGASVTKQDKMKRTALTHAVINGMTHVTAYLLRYGMDPDTADSSGNTPTHYAAAYGWYFCMKILIDAEAKLNSINDWKLTPLAVAYMKGHMGLVDLLLKQQGIDINCRDDQGMTLVTATVAGNVDEGSIDQLTYLIKQKGADPKPTDASGNTALHWLAAANIESKAETNSDGSVMVNMAKLLVENGVDVNTTNDAGGTPLSISVETGKLELANYLVETGAVLQPISEVIPSEKNKSNLLHHLIEQLIVIPSDDTKKTQFLVENVSWEFQLFNSLREKQPNEVTELLKSVDENGLSPFLLAVSKYINLDESDWKTKIKSKLKNLIVAILEFGPFVIGQRSEKVKSASENEEESGSEEEEEEEEEEDEVESGDYPSQSDRIEKAGKGDLNVGRTVFHLMAQAKEEEHLGLLEPLGKYLKSYKPDQPGQPLLDCVDGRGESAIFSAVRNGGSNFALYLIELGCDVNAVRHLPECLKRKESGKEEKRGSKKTRGSTGHWPDQVTVLMEAVRVELDKVIDGLLKVGARVTAVDSDGNTALHYGCMVVSSNVTIVKRLIEAGANVQAKNKQGRTPLHLACNADSGATDVSTETLTWLLSHGADPFVKDFRDRLPLHYAFVKIGSHEDVSYMDPVALCTVLTPRMVSQPNLADKFGRRPLHYAASRGANICCMTLLRHTTVDRNAKDNDGNTALALAVMHGHMACALTLLQADADVDVDVKWPDKANTMGNEDLLIWTPQRQLKSTNPKRSLASAVVDREWQGVVYLLIDIFTKKGQSLQPLLEAAVENRKYNLALTLLRMTSEQPPSNQTGKNLFHILASNDTPDSPASVQLQLDVAEAILRNGVPADEHKHDADGPFHPAFYAAKRRNVPLLKYFLEKGSSRRALNEYIISSTGHTILTMFLWNTPVREWTVEERDMLDQLIKKYGLLLDVWCQYPVPVDFTATDPTASGYWSQQETMLTPLIHAIHARSSNSVKNLIKAGASVNFPDDKDTTPLMHAVRLNEPDIAKLLLNLEHCPSTEEPKHRVEIYSKSGDDEEVKVTSNSDGKRKTPSRRLNVDGEPVLPISQFSMDGTTASQAPTHPDQTAKRRKVDSLKMTSGLDLNAVDREGRSVLHYCVAPFTLGGWSNMADLLKLLIDLGADPKLCDRDGSSAVDYAKKYGQLELVKAIMGNMEKLEQKIDQNWNVGRSDDGQTVMEKLGDTVNIEKDAKEYLEKARKEKATESEGNEEKRKTGKLKPHRLSGYADHGEIVLDSSGIVSTSEDGSATEPQPYDVLLNKVDLNYGLYGFYNFYRMQLIKRKGSELYILFTNWGRIGDDGQFQKTPYGKLEDAVKEFKNVFRSKTGNDWAVDIVKKFVEHPKKYRLINKEEDAKLEEDSSALDVPILLDTPLKSSLPDHLQRFLADITDTKELAESVKRVFRRSKFDLTLTALKRDAILKADTILNEIGNKLKELEELKKSAHEKEKLEAGLKIYQEISDMSVEFYFLLPLRGFERTRLPVIDDLSNWSETKSAVELLLKHEMANELLCAAAERRSNVHPFDYVYAAMRTRMERLDEDSSETQSLLHYIHNSAGNSKVMAIYKIWNKTQGQRYVEVAEKIGNRWLLWHGTRAANVMSIVQGGLMIAPPQALHSGQLFGKGIYTSDYLEKSMRYCSASKSGRKYAFLCEVALGKVARLTDLDGLDVSTDPLPEGYDSVQGVGQHGPQPQHDFVLKDGVKIPLGQRIPQECVGKDGEEIWLWLEYNEFIVYNPHQILLRYMVIFR